MEVLVALACLVLGLVVGVLAGMRRRAAPATPEAAAADAAGEVEERPAPGLDAGVENLLSVLRSSAVVVDPGDAVVMSSPAASALGLVRDGELVHSELRHLVRRVRHDGVVREIDLELARGPIGEGTLSVSARVVWLDERHIVLLVEDLTQAKRVEEVRRDFVANVSHELKTPVGGIALLAEAVLDANDDPEAVTRFARRIVIESNRLTRLVQEIVDLSRLQAAESLGDPVVVDIGSVVQECLELTGTLAERRDIALVVDVEGRPCVYGDGPLLRTAVNNLLTNAINYSADHTRVAVTARERDGVVEVAVADQGAGIAESEQTRIFERFYRVDAARSRATGGTGLGLAIVKHISQNHGGEVRVWSSLGNGSTFTIRIPSARPAAEAPDRPTGVAAPTEEVIR